MNLVNTLPRNAGVRRLCLIISIILVAVCCLIDWDFHKYHEFYLLSEEEGVWILPLLFVIPFVCCKGIEYIVDGFKQEEKPHEKKLTSNISSQSKPKSQKCIAKQEKDTDWEEEVHLFNLGLILAIILFFILSRIFNA